MSVWCRAVRAGVLRRGVARERRQVTRAAGRSSRVSMSWGESCGSAVRGRGPGGAATSLSLQVRAIRPWFRFARSKGAGSCRCGVTTLEDRHVSDLSGPTNS